MSWMVAMLAVLTAQGDGGTSSSVAAFHEPMTRPVPMKRLDWRYPPELLARRVSGLIILACVLSEEGVVEDCEVVKPLEGATDWAVGKVKSTRYTPVTLDGKPVRVRYVYSIRLSAGGAPAARSLRRGGDRSCRSRWPSPVVARTQRCAMRSRSRCCGRTRAARTSTGPLRLLGAACAAGHGAACAKLERSFVAPSLLQDLPQPTFPVPSLVRVTRAAWCPPRAAATTASSNPVR